MRYDLQKMSRIVLTEFKFYKQPCSCIDMKTLKALSGLPAMANLSAIMAKVFGLKPRQQEHIRATRPHIALLSRIRAAMSMVWSNEAAE